MAVTRLGSKIAFADITFSPESIFFLCYRRVINEKGEVVLPGGYWHGPDLFICSSCTRTSDLHQLGAVIGDAIVADYQPQWAEISVVVKQVMSRLENSVLRAIIVQLQERLKVKK